MVQSGLKEKAELESLNCVVISSCASHNTGGVGLSPRLATPPENVDSKWVWWLQKNRELFRGPPWGLQCSVACRGPLC